jgi:predicted transcriptional regulator
MRENNWTYSDLAMLADVCDSTIYKTLQGSTATVNRNILNLVEELGEEPQKFSKKYQEFRAAKRKELINQ